MAERIVALIGWREAAALRENKNFLLRASEQGKIRPRDWRSGSLKARSLVLRADGACELNRFTVATLARRLEGGAGLRDVREKGNGQSG